MNRKEFLDHVIASHTSQLGHPDANVRAKARSILQDLILEDPARVAKVLERLADPEPAAREDCVRLLEDLVLNWRNKPPPGMNGVASALVAALDDPHPAVRREAVCAVACLPSSTSGLGTHLARLAGDADLSVRREAMRLLHGVGGDDHDVIHGLAAGLQDSDSQVRMEAAIAFCYRSGWPPKEAWLRSTFLEALDDPNPGTRSLALRGIWQTDWRAESSMAAFLKHIEDPDLKVRQSALNEILNVAANAPDLARPAVPALLRALGDPKVAVSAAQALVKAAPGEPALHDYLKSLLDRVGANAAGLCLEARAHVEEAVGLVLEALRDSSTDLPFSFHDHYSRTNRNTVAEALLEHARPGDVRIEDLRSIDADADPVLAVQIAAVIVRLSPGDAALRRVAEGLEHEGDRVRELTAWTLPHTIRADGRIVQLALRVLGDPLEGVRAGALHALSKTEKAPLEVLPALLDHLGRGDAYQKDLMLKLIGSIGPEAASAGPAVLGVIDGPQEGIRGRALITLASIRASHPACVPHYVRALEGDSESLRMWALLGLQVMGVAAAAALPAIARALADPNGEMRLRAVMALAEVGRAQAGTRITLARIAGTDPEERVRRMAAYALGWLPAP